jgi:hypothetical protein
MSQGIQTLKHHLTSVIFSKADLPASVLSHELIKAIRRSTEAKNWLMMDVETWIHAEKLWQLAYQFG